MKMVPADLREKLLMKSASNLTRFRLIYSTFSSFTPPRLSSFVPSIFQGLRSLLASRRLFHPSFQGFVDCIWRWMSNRRGKQLTTPSRVNMSSGDIEDASILRVPNQMKLKWRYILQLSSRISITVCVLSLVVDTLFLYVPVLDRRQNCIGVDKKIGIVASSLRSVFDLIFIAHVLLQCYTTDYFAVVSVCISQRFQDVSQNVVALKRSFYLLVDLLSILPLPKLFIIASRLTGANVTKNALQWSIFFQYAFRFGRIYPIYKDIRRSSGTFFQNAVAGAALNLMMYLLACQLVGSFYYFFSLERVETCWREACLASQCDLDHLHCDPQSKKNNHFLDGACLLTGIPNPTSNFDFGIFNDALKSGILEHTNFKQKFLYCFWWSFRNLCSLGQGLNTSSFELEICFSVFIATLGLLLFAWIICNIQNYLQSSIKKVEEMRVKKRDRERWMSNLRLSADLKQRIRKHEQHKWLKTRGLEEDSMFQSLPNNLRRQVNRHIGLKLLQKVTLFRNIADEQFLRTICDHLKIIRYPEDSIIWERGDRVDALIFVARGTLKRSFDIFGNIEGSYITRGGFCGDELFKLILDPSSSVGCPPCHSTWTITAVSEVEVFFLGADDLTSIASQHPRVFHQIRHVLRAYPHQGTWAACYIQAAWRRRIMRKQKQASGV